MRRDYVIPTYWKPLLPTVMLAILIAGLVGCSKNDSPTASAPIVGNTLVAVTITPPDTGYVLDGEAVVVKVVYHTDADSMVTFKATPYSGGSTSPNAVMKISTVSPTGMVDSASSVFGIMAGDVTVDSVLVTMSDHTGAELASRFVPANLQFTKTYITNIQISPASPDTLGVGDYVYVTYDCGTSQANGFYTWAIPWNNGRLPLQSAYAASQWFPTGRHSVSRFFRFRDAGSADAINILMRDSSMTTTLQSDTLSADYVFTP